jgi:hypothetical protein
MACVTTYHCPTCWKSPDPWLGLIQKPYVDCSCGTRVYVSHDLIVANWARILYLRTTLAAWLGLMVLAVVAPGKPGADAVGAMIGMVLFGWFPGLIFAAFGFPIYYAMGHSAARRLAKQPPSAADYASRYGVGRMPQDHDWR